MLLQRIKKFVFLESHKQNGICQSVIMKVRITAKTHEESGTKEGVEGFAKLINKIIRINKRDPIAINPDTNTILLTSFLGRFIGNPMIVLNFVLFFSR